MTINYETLWASLVFYGLNVVYAVVLLGVGWYLSGVCERFVYRSTRHARRVDPLVTNFLASLAQYSVLAVMAIAVLQLFGIQTASLVAVLGATSLAIGLALQGTLTNLAAGVMLLLFRPFRIGDNVEVGGKAGKVKSLSLFLTELVTPESLQILLPNGSVWGQAIINRSTYAVAEPVKKGKIDISFPVLAGETAERMRRDLLSVLTNDARVDGTIPPTAAISKIVDLSKPNAGVVELTINAELDSSRADDVKAMLFDRINAMQIQAPARTGSTQVYALP